MKFEMQRPWREIRCYHGVVLAEEDKGNHYAWFKSGVYYELRMNLIYEGEKFRASRVKGSVEKL